MVWEGDYMVHASTAIWWVCFLPLKLRGWLGLCPWQGGSKADGREICRETKSLTMYQTWWTRYKLNAAWSYNLPDLERLIQVEWSMIYLWTTETPPKSLNQSDLLSKCYEKIFQAVQSLNWKLYKNCIAKTNQIGRSRPSWSSDTKHPSTKRIPDLVVVRWDLTAIG